MQDIINRILEGNFDYENGSLDFSCAKIEFTLQKGSTFEGSFHILSSPGQITNGYVYSSDSRMECLTPEFAGTEAEVFYCFHSENMEEGDVVKGAFCVVSNHGEYYLPFVASVEHTVINSSMGKIKNLFHFANLAKSSWQEALKLFYSPNFSSVLAGSDAHYYDSYRALSVRPGNEQNMEEFLIQINKKQKVEFLLEEPQLTWELTLLENPYSVVEAEVKILRNGWGYTALTVACEGDFVFTEREFLSDDDFLGNCCCLPVYIDSSMCCKGKNFGRILLYNSYVSLEVTVVVHLGDNTAKGHAGLDQKHTVVQLLKSYQAFRLKKISKGTWLKETGRLVESLVALNEKDIASRLYQAQLLITEERYKEAGWLLDHSADMLEQNDMVDSTLWAYYLYLTTLIHCEEAYVDQVAARVERIYQKNKHPWRVAWLLLFLSAEYSKSPSAKWNFLEKQFSYGCRSPIIYIEALQLVNNNPALLRKLDSYELQVMYFGVRQEYISAGAVEQLLYLAGRLRGYLPVLKDILIRLYEKKADVRILQEICTLLIKGGKVGEKYFAWYQKGVEQQFRITNLFEYYMMSVDINETLTLPKIVLLYFSYQNNLDYERCAYLYHYVLQHRDEYAELYNVYQPKIERFVMEQIQKGHINRHLAGLYQEMLTPAMVTEYTAGYLARLLFAHQVHVEKPGMQKVLVYHPGSCYPAVYPLQADTTWVALYGNEYTIAFEDAWGNRFINQVEYTLEKLMLPGKYIKTLAHYVTDCLELDVYLCLNEQLQPEDVKEREERYKRVAASRQVEPFLRREVCLKLLQCYYDADDMRALDDYLETIPGEELSLDERAEVMRYLVLRGKYEKAYLWLNSYGPYFMDAKLLMRLVSTVIQRKGYEEDSMLLAAALQVFRKGKYDSTVLEYLCRYFQGMTKELRDIWKAARSFDVDCYGLSERMLVQMLYSGAFVGEKMDIFRYYVSQGARQEIEAAVLAQCSFDYFVLEKLTEEAIFQEISHAYQRGETVQKISKLAFLKFYAENKELLTEDKQGIAEEFLQEMMREGVRLNLFREYSRLPQLIQSMSDKIIVEYRMHPGGRARIHYVMLHENGETEEYLSEYMKEAYSGVFFKEFVLFFGETLQYYIVEETAGGEQLTESGNLQKSDWNSQSEDSKYDMINDMILSITLQDYDTLDNLLEEYYRKEYLNQYLFRIQ